MFKAEEYYRKDSVNLALNGDGQYLGFSGSSINIVVQMQANLAHFYAGVAI